MGVADTENSNYLSQLYRYEEFLPLILGIIMLQLHEFK